MKRNQIFATLLSFFIALKLVAQEGEMPEPEGMTLPDLIGQIAESGEAAPLDYMKMSIGTIQVAKTVMEKGQPFPESSIQDGLDAVAAGRTLDPEFADWDSVEQELLNLLAPPPPQDQQDQQQQQNEDSESQEGDEGEQDQEGSGQQSSQENGDESEQEQQQGENFDEQQQQDPSQQGDGEQENQQNQEDPSSDQEGEGEQSQTQAKDGAQMGDLEQNQDPQDIQLDSGEENQQQPPEQMQTLGGQTTSGEPIDAESAALMQMLEQLKQQDEPGKIYKILQEAEAGERQKPKTDTKDW